MDEERARLKKSSRKLAYLSGALGAVAYSAAPKVIHEIKLPKASFKYAIASHNKITNLIRVGSVGLLGASLVQNFRGSSSLGDFVRGEIGNFFRRMAGGIGIHVAVAAAAPTIVKGLKSDPVRKAAQSAGEAIQTARARSAYAAAAKAQGKGPIIKNVIFRRIHGRVIALAAGKYGK